MKQKRLSPAEAKTRACILWEQGNALPLPHFKKRLIERNVTMADIQYLLNSGTVRRSASYNKEHGNWRYIIEGCDLDGIGLSLVFGFDETFGALLLITVTDV